MSTTKLKEQEEIEAIMNVQIVLRATISAPIHTTCDTLALAMFTLIFIYNYYNRISSIILKFRRSSGLELPFPGFVMAF